MQQTYTENLGKILKNKGQIEKELNVKISNQGKSLFILGDAENEYLCLKVIDAINAGFSVQRALLLKDEGTVLQVLNIRDLTRRNDLTRIKARIIGTGGKTICNLNNLSDCFISVKDNEISIIGESETIEEAVIALKSLIQGSKQSRVYSRLERKKKERRLSPPEIIKNEFAFKE